MADPLGLQEALLQVSDIHSEGIRRRWKIEHVIIRRGGRERLDVSAIRTCRQGGR